MRVSVVGDICSHSGQWWSNVVEIWGTIDVEGCRDLADRRSNSYCADFIDIRIDGGLCGCWERESECLKPKGLGLCFVRHII